MSTEWIMENVFPPLIEGRVIKLRGEKRQRFLAELRKSDAPAKSASGDTMPKPLPGDRAEEHLLNSFCARHRIIQKTDRATGTLILSTRQIWV